ncbi:MAG: SDR family NAD(P)-dependent oxidoreductase, partial [Polyangiaceae bacterium]
NYPFQRERFWIDVAPESAEQEARSVAPPPSTPFVALSHEIVWREGPVAGGALPAPAAVSALVSPLIAEVAAEAGLTGYAPFSVALDALAAQYISSALRALGADLQPGSTFNRQALAERLRVIPRHSRLFSRLLQILVEDRLIERTSSDETADFRVLTPFGVGDPDALAERLLARHPDGAAEITLTSRCARELAPVLRGELDPLPLLFPDGSVADMERLYRTSPPAKTYNQLISEVVAAFDRAWSRARPLRILEIGGGTGSTTAYVLPKLRDDRVEYTFTDLSPLFLNRAREKFASRACLHTALLDLSSDPAAQGFAPGSFDLIIGANVVHATPDIAVSLGHALRLLSPGGQLVLLEGTTAQRFGDLTVGLLEGWWAFSDLARRQYALMSRAAWLAAFRETGFGSAAVIVDADAGPVLEQQAIFVAQAPIAPPASSSTRWLILPDDSQIADALAKELQSTGVDASVLDSGTQSLAIALSRAAATGSPISAVVQLSALDARLDDTTSPAALWADQERLVRSALDTVHALTTGAVSGSPPSLCFVTHGAQPTHANDAVNPAQASLWGLSHVVALEHPELACRRIDLDGAIPVADSVRALALELRDASGEDQVALRGERRLLRRLVAKTVAAAGSAPNIRADRTYLITGGLRGLGLLVAGWLVAQGARSLVLMSRRPPDTAAEAKLTRLRAQGAQVLARTGDVSSEPAVAAVFDEIARTLPALAGIVHAAGVLDDGALSAQDWGRFATVMAPKVLGTWHLHRLAPALDFFALFSSGAAIAGSAGQANHAAANAFEDALAWYRQARGLPTVSINWGPWADVGAAADRNVSGPSFVMQIAPKDGLRALAAALVLDAAKQRLTSAQWVVIATDWSQLAQAPLAWRNSPLFRELSPSLSVQAQTTRAELPTSELPLRERLLAVAPNRRRAALQDQVR